MKPVHEILNRIRWDNSLEGREFKIGYYDRIEEKLVVVPFRALIFPRDSHFCFELIDREGVVHTIPYHRVKAIYQNDELIWYREH